MNYEILVNRNNKINNDYIDLIKIVTREIPTLSNDNNMLLEKTAYDMWLKLLKQAKNNGYDFDVISGYRDADYQQNVLEYYIDKLGFDKAIMMVAIPNYSEHQTGLAIDYTYYRKQIINNISVSKEIEQILEDDPEYIWITTNMHNYGFILRYPKDKTSITGYSYEPWHIRYVGIKIAEYIYENNITLEEYHEKKLQQ